MDITWLIIITVLATLAVVSTIVAVRGQAPRLPADPELVARLRDRVTETASRRLAPQLDQGTTAVEAARGSAPQRGGQPTPQPTLQPTGERIWAGGV